LHEIYNYGRFVIYEFNIWKIAMTTKLKKLEQQQARIKLQIAKEKKKGQTQQRKQDTRRKILIGAIALEEMKKDAKLKSQIDKLLESNLTRSNDRELFDLLPIEDKKTEVSDS